MYFNYLSLPQIPDNLLENLIDLQNKPFAQSTLFDYDTSFKLKDVPIELHNYLVSIFDTDITVRYQFIMNDLPIHVDKGDRQIAFNYILETGGDNVITNVYDFDMKLINSECIIPKRWHYIKTCYPHMVKNVTSTRIAITVVINNYDEQRINAFLEKWRRAEESNPIRFFNRT